MGDAATACRRVRRIAPGTTVSAGLTAVASPARGCDNLAGAFLSLRIGLAAWGGGTVCFDNFRNRGLDTQ